MTSTEIYFCDTYALIELLNGNPDYANYIYADLVTLDLNLMELYYSSLRDSGKHIANKDFHQFVPFSYSFSKSIIPIAMEFKLKYRKENLSYVDCVGYVFAKQNNLLFLTGDEKFEKKENVKFVK